MNIDVLIEIKKLFQEKKIDDVGMNDIICIMFRGVSDTMRDHLKRHSDSHPQAQGFNEAVDECADYLHETGEAFRPEDDDPLGRIIHGN